MDTGAWWTAVREVSKSWIQLSMHVSKTDTRISGLSLLITYCVNLSTSDSWRRKRPPTPVLLPGESHGWRSLVGYSPWGRKESDMSLISPLVTEAINATSVKNRYHLLSPCSGPHT